MTANAAVDRLKRELHRMIDNMRCELDRIEILVAALHGFSRPVPDYEPRFLHLPHFGSSTHEMSKRTSGR